MQMKMEDMSLSGLDNSKLEVSGPPGGLSGCPPGALQLSPLLSNTVPSPPHPMPQAIAHEIYTDLVEDACLGLCFEVHRAVKCGYFFLDDTDPDSMKDFGEPPPAPGTRRAPPSQCPHGEAAGELVVPMCRGLGARASPWQCQHVPGPSQRIHFMNRGDLNPRNVTPRCGTLPWGWVGGGETPPPPPAALPPAPGPRCRSEGPGRDQWPKGLPHNKGPELGVMA